eukprot:9014285-Pyramimonas_sp.AAC.1
MVRADYTTAFPTRIQEYIHTLRCDSVGTLPCCSRAPPHTGGTLSGGSTALPRFPRWGTTKRSASGRAAPVG